MERAPRIRRVDEITGALIEALSADPRLGRITLAIVYGSVARGTHRDDSDIDLGICIDPYTPINDETLYTAASECERATGREVQVRDLARAQGVFLKEVLVNGVVIRQTDSRTQGDLIIRMLSFVEDLLPTIREIRGRKRERFLAG